MVHTMMSIQVETAFRVAASMALRAAAKKANPVILEPMMKVVITVPEDYLGDVMGRNCSSWTC